MRVGEMDRTADGTGAHNGVEERQSCVDDAGRGEVVDYVSR